MVFTFPPNVTWTFKFVNRKTPFIECAWRLTLEDLSMGSRKCQTSTATPAVPGDFPAWFKTRRAQTAAQVTALGRLNVAYRARSAVRGTTCQAQPVW